MVADPTTLESRAGLERRQAISYIQHHHKLGGRAVVQMKKLAVIVLLGVAVAWPANCVVLPRAAGQCIVATGWR